MNREELFELLEIDTSEDFCYFEQFAEMIECQEEIEFDDFYAVLYGADGQSVAEINENYFTELEKAFPDDHDDAYEIVESIWNNLKLLAGDLDNERSRREYAEQLFKFHEWYTRADGAAVDGSPCSVMEAVCENRLSKLENTAHTYDFSNSLDYELDDVSIRLGGFGDEQDDSNASLQDD